MPLTVLALPDYIVEWEPKQVAYVVNETPAIQWAITRQDGGLVPVPTAGTVTLIAPDGTLQSSNAPFISSGIPAVQINIGVDTFQLSQTGEYKATLSGVTFTGTDVQARGDQQSIYVNLPYDGGLSPLGQVRKYSLDTDLSRPFFSDTELLGYLNDCDQFPIYAAALALETLAADQARRAMAVRVGPFASNNSTSTHNAIAQRAEMLRNLNPAIPVVTQQTRVFTMGDPDLGTTGTIDLW